MTLENYDEYRLWGAYFEIKNSKKGKVLYKDYLNYRNPYFDEKNLVV